MNAIKAPSGAELAYRYPDNTRMGGSEVRVIYLKQSQSQRDFQEVVNAVRTISDIPKIYHIGESHAIFLRSYANQIAAAEWLIGMLDQPAGQAGTNASYTMQPTELPGRRRHCRPPRLLPAGDHSPSLDGPRQRDPHGHTDNEDLSVYDGARNRHARHR